MKTIYIAAFVILVAACSSTGIPRAKTPMSGLLKVDADLAEPGWDDTMCFNLMSERDSWRFAGAFLAGIGGAGGITAAAVPGSEPNDWPQWTAGTVALASGAAGAAAALVAKSKAEAFERYCEIKDDPQRQDPVDPTAGLGLPKPGTNPAPTRTVEKPETTADGGTDGGE